MQAGALGFQVFAQPLDDDRLLLGNEIQPRAENDDEDDENDDSQDKILSTVILVGRPPAMPPRHGSGTRPEGLTRLRPTPVRV